MATGAARRQTYPVLQTWSFLSRLRDAFASCKLSARVLHRDPVARRDRDSRQRRLPVSSVTVASPLTTSSAAAATFGAPIALRFVRRPHAHRFAVRPHAFSVAISLQPFARVFSRAPARAQVVDAGRSSSLRCFSSRGRPQRSALIIIYFDEFRSLVLWQSAVDDGASDRVALLSSRPIRRSFRLVDVLVYTVYRGVGGREGKAPADTVGPGRR